MSDYRLKFYNQDGSLVFLMTLVCVDDQAAIECSAEKHYDGRAMELWDRNRKVAAFGVRHRQQPSQRPLTADVFRFSMIT